VSVFDYFIKMTTFNNNVLAVVGSRTFTDYAQFCSELDKLKNCEFDFSSLVSGGANGADKMAERYARERGIPIKILKPNWYPNGRYDKGAGIRRNFDIINGASYVIAFWDGVSSGTNHSIKLAQKKGNPVKKIEFKN
jgi:hypothetical protein